MFYLEKKKVTDFDTVSVRVVEKRTSVSIVKLVGYQQVEVSSHKMKNTIHSAAEHCCTSTNANKQTNKQTKKKTKQIV